MTATALMLLMVAMIFGFRNPSGMRHGIQVCGAYSLRSKVLSIECEREQRGQPLLTFAELRADPGFRAVESSLGEYLDSLKFTDSGFQIVTAREVHQTVERQVMDCTCPRSSVDANAGSPPR